jgi:hypothetical protein
LTLPSFEIGRVIVVSRDVAAATDQRTESTRGQQAAELAEPPALMPLASPFMDLGRRETGTTHLVEIPLRNLRPEPVRVIVESIGQSASNPANVEVAPITIPPDSDGVLTGKLKVPASAIPSVTRLRVSPTGAQESGFDVFIDVEAYEMLTSDPKLVDCGQFARLDASNSRSVNIHSEDPHFRIERVRTIGVPVDVEMGPDRKSFQFRATPAERGSFAGTIEIKVAISGRDSSVRTLTVPFAGRYLREVSAEPHRLILWNNRHGQTREIVVRHFEKQAVSIVRAEGLAPWLHVRFNTAATTTSPVVEVAVLPGDRPAGDSVVHIECRTADGALHSITIPVKIVGNPGANPSDRTGPTDNDGSEGAPTRMNVARPDGPDSEDAGDEVSAEHAQGGPGDPSISGVVRQVEGLLKAAHTGDSPREMQNWLKVHRLITFGDNAFLNGAAHTRAVLDGVLHPSSRDGPFVIRSGRPFPRRTGDRFDQEHHHDQFLSYISMCGIPLDATLFVDENRFQLRDLLDNSLRESRTTGELAWTVSAYAYYLQPGRRWSNKFGEPMSLAILAESLLAEKEGACGGTHQLFAMSRVLSRPALKQDEQLAAVWPRLERRVSIAVQQLQASQNPSGDFGIPASLRERLLARPDATPNRMGVYYTGHCVEWLVLALAPDQLSEPWVLRAVEYLTGAIAADFIDVASTLYLRTDEQHYQYGFQAHAISALVRWHARVAESRRR